MADAFDPAAEFIGAACVPPCAVKNLIHAGLLCLALSVGRCAAAEVPPVDRKKISWGEALLRARASLKTEPSMEHGTSLSRCCEALQTDYPVSWDWALQDSDGRFPEWFQADTRTEWEKLLIARVLEELGNRGVALRQEYDALCQASASASDARWWDLYVRACDQRRAARLTTVREKSPQIVFTKRRTLQPSFFAYTEGQSDAQHERHFHPNSQLCLWTLTGSSGQMRTLVADPGGVIRDPAVSWDGERVLFAWKKSLDQDDYHLYDLTIASGHLRQLTSGLGFADYEPAYLPNGDIVFSSTRCVQTVDCWWTEVSNLFTCDANGRYLRRLGFDQVHTVYPQVLDDGRVVYTRWDYNDRGQMFPQALFQMNPDGTGQTEFYKNNSWFPTTVAHARGIPGTEKVMAIFMGHHTAQAGKLGILDPGNGRQENTGAQLVAPVRETRAERRDDYGQEGELFQYPFPLTETEFLVGFAPLGWQKTQQRKGGADFGIYWMDLTGRRELLVTDPALACQQPVPLVARTPPPTRPRTVDYSKTAGTYYMQDIYAGAALAGVPRGMVKKLRVIALDFRAAGVGNNGSMGPSGEALVSTPIAIGNGSWDVKIVLGDAKVHDDGSAFFTVPARTPVYFQALDAKNRAVQTMRSWSTLQPGENQACVGCHEPKNITPLAASSGRALALQAGPQPLDPFYGPPRGFSFAKEIQPILNRHCIRCHNDPNLKMDPKRQENAVTRDPDPVWKRSFGDGGVAGTGVFNPNRAKPTESGASDKPAFSLSGEAVLDQVAKRSWSRAYLNLTLSEPSDYYEAPGAYFGVFDGCMVNWIGSQSIPAPLPPYAAGACRSKLFSLLEADHYGVKLVHEELDKLACWMDLLVPYGGDYFEANAWTPEEREKYERYLAKRRRMEAAEQQNIQAFLGAHGSPAANCEEPRPQTASFVGSYAGAEHEVWGIILCWCPAGRFTMGSPPGELERRPDEDQVEVTLSQGFWMGKYELTQGQWKQVMGKLPGPLTAELPEGPDYPVGNVTFAEAEAFCRKLTETAHADGQLPSDWEFRLPTEAQWEYACRAGTTTATAFGDKLSSTQANFKGKPYNGAQPGPSLNRAAKVGSYPANAWGLHDMHGNTFEWCRDWYQRRLPGGVDPDLYSAEDLATKSEHGGTSRVRRGGCWADEGWPCRSAFRLRFEPQRRYDHIGFRVVALQL